MDEESIMDQIQRLQLEVLPCSLQTPDLDIVRNLRTELRGVETSQEADRTEDFSEGEWRRIPQRGAERAWLLQEQLHLAAISGRCWA